MHAEIGTTAEAEHLSEVDGVELAQSRAGFVRKAGLLGGGVLAASGAAAFAGIAQGATAGAAGDVKVLNFALTLEYLEAEFYRKAVAGDFGRLNAGVRRFAALLAEHEQEHVEAIRATIPKLGGRPVSKPALRFPKLNQRRFVRTAIALEQTGVGAYAGAFPSLKLTPVKEAALAIHSVEARHAAYARLVAGTLPANVAFFPALTADEVLARAKPFFA